MFLTFVLGGLVSGDITLSDLASQNGFKTLLLSLALGNKIITSQEEYVIPVI